jgi:hypothetical protein
MSIQKEFSPRKLRDAENKMDALAIVFGAIGSFCLLIGAYLWYQAPEFYNKFIMAFCKGMFWYGLMLCVITGIYLLVKKY